MKKYEAQPWREQWAVWVSCSQTFCDTKWHLLRPAETKTEAETLTNLYRDIDYLTRQVQ